MVSVSCQSSNKAGYVKRQRNSQFVLQLQESDFQGYTLHLGDRVKHGANCTPQVACRHTVSAAAKAFPCASCVHH